MAVTSLVPMRLLPLAEMAMMLMVSCMVLEAMGKEGGSSPQKLAVPAFDLGNDVVAGFVEASPEGAVAAHHEATISPLTESGHRREQKLITRLTLNDEGGNDGKELVFEEGRGHGWKEGEPLGSLK